MLKTSKQQISPKQQNTGILQRKEMEGGMGSVSHHADIFSNSFCLLNNNIPSVPAN